MDGGFEVGDDDDDLVLFALMRRINIFTIKL